jgi:hypothetical protein
MSNIPVNVFTLFAVGVAGGFVNGLITGFRKAGIIKDSNGRESHDWGWRGDLLLGGVAALVTWASGLANPNSPQIFVICLFSGIGSARVFKGIMDDKLKDSIVKHLTVVAGEKADVFEKLPPQMGS